MKALLVARRELGDLLSDRSFSLGLVALMAVPLVLVSTVGGTVRDPTLLILVFAIQSTIFPAFMSVNAAAATFIQDKEGQTLLPLLAAPIRDEQIIFGKMIAIFVPATLAAWLTLSLYTTAAAFRFGTAKTFAVLSPPMLFALGVLAAILVLTLGSWSMIIASRVRTVRAAQQLAGLLVAVVTVGLLAGAQYLTSVLDGWLIVFVPVAVLALDIAALELTRRLWGREEAIARI